MGEKTDSHFFRRSSVFPPQRCRRLVLVAKRPVSPCRQARPSPAGPDPGGLVCAPEPSFHLLYRKPAQKATTNGIGTVLRWVCAGGCGGGKEASLRPRRIRQVAQRQMCRRRARAGCIPPSSTEGCEPAHPRSADCSRTSLNRPHGIAKNINNPF